MLSASEIRNAKFGKAVGGYKQEDVDILLDRIEADYVTFERTIKDFQAKTDALNKEIEELKNSQSSIQNVLLSAQRLADQIVNEAKVKSEEIIHNAEANISLITAQEKELSQTFEMKAQDRKATLEKELEEMVKTAQAKADSIKAASDDAVARQQILFDKLKMEIAAFKSGITAKYKEHLELLSTLPDSVPMDPKAIADAVAIAIDKAPAPESFIKEEKKADAIEELYNKDDYSADEQLGFTVAQEDEDEEA
ncbi:MAG: DivIVA domain-containing protein [Clostridia bacterium]|nr:DivIVA domain-containing protein [Clostridia bacterium]